MMNLHIDVAGFLQTLPIMLKGMIGIFLVIVLIWAFIAVLNRATAPKKNNQKDAE